MRKVFIAIFFLLVFLNLPKLASASTLSLSPGSGRVGVGGSITVSVRLNAGSDAINGVLAYLAYPADKLDVTYVNPGGAFAIQAENSFGGGIIKISRGSLSPVSGSVTVATIGLRGKTVGSAVVNFIGGSAAPRATDSSDSLNLSGSTGAVITIAQSVPKPSTKTNAATPNTGQASSPSTALKISDLKVTNVSTNSANITWKTDVATQSEVDYGLEPDKYFLSASNGNAVTNHALVLDSPFLTPGLKFHFRVISHDDSGSFVKSDDYPVQLLGYNLKLKFIDQNGQPLNNVDVTIYSDPQTQKTDQNGEATFTNMVLGKHIAIVKNGLFEKTAEINVADGPLDQSYNLKLNFAEGREINSDYKLPLIIGSIVLILVIVIGIVLFLKRRTNKTNIEIPE